MMEDLTGSRRPDPSRSCAGPYLPVNSHGLVEDELAAAGPRGDGNLLLSLVYGDVAQVDDELAVLQLGWSLATR